MNCDSIIIFNTKENNLSFIITIINFIFGIVLIYPFLIEWDNIYFNLKIIKKNILEYQDKISSELIVLKSESDYYNLDRKNIEKAEFIFSYLKDIISSKSVFLKHVFIHL
jgi:hypothetical protein